MSINASISFDNINELSFDDSLVSLVTTTSDGITENPFVSGNLITSGALGSVDGNVVSGYVTSPSFVEVVSGQPLENSSGEVVSFSFSEPQKLYSISILQNSDNYAVDYEVTANNGSLPLIKVYGSSNSGDINHLLANPELINSLDIKVTKINNNASTYEFVEISGEADSSLVVEKINRSDLDNVEATSVVEPVENLFDDNTLTFWQSNNSYPQEVIFTFKEIENIHKFNYVSEDSSTYPAEYELYKYNNTTNLYELIETKSNLLSGTIDNTYYPPHSTNKIKWVIKSGISTKVRIRDVEFFRLDKPEVSKNEISLKPSVTSGIENALTVYSNTFNNPNVLANAFKADSKFWKSNNVFTAVSGTAIFNGSERIVFDLGLQKTLDAIKWQNNDGDGIPVDFAIHGSDDNVSFDLIREITGNANNRCNLSFSDEINTYRYYSITVTRSNAEYVKLNYISLETVSYPAEASVLLPEMYIDNINSFDLSYEIPFPSTDVRYIAFVNGKKYWFNGFEWIQSNGRSDNSNAYVEFNSNLSKLKEKFGENYLFSVSIVMVSDTTATPVLSYATVNYNNEKNSIFVPKNLIRIKGYLSGYPGTLRKPVEIEVYLKRSAIVVDKETITFNVKKIYSDDTGYFDFTLPQTENANPEKARYVIVIPSVNLRRERYTPAVSEISLSDWLSGNF